MDNKLNFKAHIRNISARIARSIGIFTKLRHIFPSSALPFLCYALIYPHLSFGLPIWGSTYPTYIQKLQRLQNKVISIISNAIHKTSVTPLYKNMVFSNLLTYIIVKWPKLCISFLNKRFPHVLIAYLTHSLPCMSVEHDLKLSKFFIFLNSQPPDVKILLNTKDQKFRTL